MKVLYLGPEEDFEVESADGKGTETVKQGEVVEVSAETAQHLKDTHAIWFWFGDEPEPQARDEKAANVQPSEDARAEMIESGARAKGASVEEATRQRTVAGDQREVRVTEIVDAEGKTVEDK